MTSGLHNGRQTGAVRDQEDPRTWVMGREDAGEGLGGEGGCALDCFLSFSSFSSFILSHGMERLTSVCDLDEIEEWIKGRESGRGDLGHVLLFFSPFLPCSLFSLPMSSSWPLASSIC